MAEANGRKIHVTIGPGLSDREFSISLYHEVLAGLTIASARAPESALHFNEYHFESAAVDAHDRFGAAAPATLDLMLHYYGFLED